MNPIATLALLLCVLVGLVLGSLIRIGSFVSALVIAAVVALSGLGFAIVAAIRFFA